MLGKLTVLIGADISGFTSAMGDVSTRLDKLGDQFEKKFASIDALGDRLTSAGASLTAALTLPIAGFATVAVQASATMDALMRGLTAVAGSAGSAKEQFGQLKEVAKLPGLTMQDAVQGAIRLQAVGVSAKDAQTYLMAFGNALATVGRGGPQLDLVITQLTQMLTKSKVVAQDLKPILEQIPQAAAVVKQAFGTIDSQELQKMGVGTQEFVRTVIAGLQQLPPITNSLRNSFENLQDKMTQSFAKVGDVLAPAVIVVTDFLSDMLDKLAAAADWFGKLPAPIQGAVIGLVGMAAAIGPIALGLGGMISVIGSVGEVLIPLATSLGLATEAGTLLLGPLGLVVAGLTALGAAVGYVVADWAANWGTISMASTVMVQLSADSDGAKNSISSMATTTTQSTADMIASLEQAAEKTGNWSKANQDLVQSFVDLPSKINEGTSLASSFGVAIIAGFKEIKSWVSQASDAISSFVSNITVGEGVISKLVAMLAGLPGPIGEFARGVQNASSEYKSYLDTIRTANTVTTGLTTAFNYLKDSHNSGAQAAKKHQAAVEEDAAAIRANDKAIQEWQKHNQGVWTRYEASLEAAWKKEKEINDARVKADEAVSAALIRQTDTLGVLKTAGIDTTTSVSDAMQQLGIKTDSSISDAIDKSIDNFNALKESGILTSSEMAQAIAKTYADLETAVKTSQGNMSSDQLDALNTELQQLRDFATDAGLSIEGVTGKNKTELKKQKDEWGTFRTDVSTTVTNFSQDVAKTLFEGNGNMLQKLGDAVKSIGEAFVSALVEKALKKGVNVLMEGLTTLLDKLSGEGGLLGALGKLGGLFGSAGSSAAGGVTGAGGSAAGHAAGSAGGAAAGAGTSILGSVIGGAVSGVISGMFDIFTTKGQNKILENMQNELIFIHHGITDKLGVIEILWILNDYNYNHLQPVVTDIASSATNIYGFMKDWVYTALTTINDSVKAAGAQPNTIMTNNFTISNTDTDAIANAVIAKLQLAGAKI